MKVKRQKEWESTLQETRLVTTPNCNLVQAVSQSVSQSYKAPYPTPRQSPPPQIIRHMTSHPLCPFSVQYGTGSVIGKEAGYGCFSASSKGREPDLLSESNG